MSKTTTIEPPASTTLQDVAVSNGSTGLTRSRRSSSSAAARIVAGMSTRRGPSLSEGFTEPEQQLQDELSSDRIIRLRADQGEQFIENLDLPNYGDLLIPGYRVIPEQQAQEMGLRGLGEIPDIPLEEEQPASAAVDGNIIPTFVDGVTGYQKIDVLNSCLLAQLAANAKFDKTAQPVEWSNYYGTVLMNLAWVVPTFAFRTLRTPVQRFTIDQVILKLVQSFLTEGQIATLTAAMEAVKALETQDRRFVIFERNSKKTTEGNFQINSIGTSADGTLSMKFNAFAFDTDTEVTNILWFSFSGHNTTLKVSQSTFVLNEQVMAKLREPIMNKLGARAVDYIGLLELAEGTSPVEG